MTVRKKSLGKPLGKSPEKFPGKSQGIKSCDKGQKDRQIIITTLFIGLTFLWTSSAYLSWTNHLSPLADSSVSYMATEAGGPIPQMIGLILFAWLLKYDVKTAMHGNLLLFVMALDGCTILPILFSEEMVTVLVWGMIMNLFHGALAGYYIARLSCYIPKNRRAFCFGVGYAIGNIGSYLLSRVLSSTVFEGSLGNGVNWLVFVGFILMSGMLYLYMERLDRLAAEEKVARKEKKTWKGKKMRKSCGLQRTPFHCPPV